MFEFVGIRGLSVVFSGGVLRGFLNRRCIRRAEVSGLASHSPFAPSTSRFNERRSLEVDSPREEIRFLIATTGIFIAS